MSKLGARLFVDIETIPAQGEGAASAARSRITAPANYKDPEKIEAYIAGKAEEAWLKTALDGSYGEVFCIGYAIDDEPAEVVTRGPRTGPMVDEADVLEEFFERVDDELIGGGIWIGHNIQRFDMRFLWKRSVIHRLPHIVTTPFNESPYSDQIRDTMMMWTGDRNSFISLDELLDILGIDSEDPIDGSEVWAHIQEGNYDVVNEHCRANVEETREAWRRMAFMPG